MSLTTTCYNVMRKQGIEPKYRLTTAELAQFNTFLKTKWQLTTTYRRVRQATVKTKVISPIAKQNPKKGEQRSENNIQG